MRTRATTPGGKRFRNAGIPALPKYTPLKPFEHIKKHNDVLVALGFLLSGNVYQ